MTVLKGRIDYSAVGSPRGCPQRYNHPALSCPCVLSTSQAQLWYNGGAIGSLARRGYQENLSRGGIWESVSGVVEDRRGGGGADVGMGPLWPPAMLSMSPTRSEAG